MKEIVNPGYRNHPCDYVPEPADSSTAPADSGNVCLRCGAESSSEDNLCAPQKN